MKALILDGSRCGDPLTPVAVLGMTSALARRTGMRWAGALAMGNPPSRSESRGTK
jgi:hypothetical protein